MAAIYSRKDLLDRLLRAVADAGWKALILSEEKPFHLVLFREGTAGIEVFVYMWTCTHGGGEKRAQDEYRIQITGVVPEIQPTGITLLLGWHDGYDVFVGWDITKHAEQKTKSPSAQVKEDALSAAHNHAFSIHRKQNDEIVVALRPEMFVEYALNAVSLHQTGESTAEEALNAIDTITTEQIQETIRDTTRRRIVSRIVRNYRAYDFRRRVLTAYENRCAACGIQLGLVEAAHIIPVADTASTDETSNGVAFCALHHSAFDSNLLSFDESYKFQVSETRSKHLIDTNLGGGLEQFTECLKTAVILPADKRDYPNPLYIVRAREVRRWAQ